MTKPELGTTSASACSLLFLLTYLHLMQVFSNNSCSSSSPVLSEADVEWIVRNTDKDKDQVEVRQKMIWLVNEEATQDFQEQFQRFLEKHPDGKISKKGFLTMMKECYPSKESDRVGRHLWRIYDLNKVLPGNVRINISLSLLL